MANSKYEYVRAFEQPDVLLKNTWVVVRIDGRGFSNFTAKHNFVKPNDIRAIHLMNAAAEAVMREISELVLAYGVSDEYSFVFHKNCELFERRASKLTTTIVSTFSSYYTFLWPTYFPNSPLTPPLPSFDGRAVCYPSDQNLRDYMSWRQVDCHINNLYNTTFWAMVQQGDMDQKSAEQALKTTVSKDKHEILFSRFGINYNNEPEVYKKGSIIYRDFSTPSQSTTPTQPPYTKIPSPPLSHPQPRPASQPLSLSSDPSTGASTPRGPTFLSTSTTPSPPPSATSLSFPSIPSLHHTFFQTTTSAPPSIFKPSLGAQLTPLPLPPPTLTPSTGPPANLGPPSMMSNRLPVTPTPNRRASITAATPPISKTSPSSSSSAQKQQRSGLKHRSPSLSILEGGKAPQIPLRISSIPVGASPRKLSLSGQQASCESGNRMKELPPPPQEKERGELFEGGERPDIANSRRSRSMSYARITSAPQVGPDGFCALQDSNPIQTLPSSSQVLSKRANASTTTKNQKNQKPPITKATSKPSKIAKSEEYPTGAPKHLSKTQIEKEKKKRKKARVVIEHVDLIRDEFWERRPWILKGTAGV